MNPNRQTATIHQFPTARVRARTGRIRTEAVAFESGSSETRYEDFSGSWYHEAAIREAEPDRKH